MTDEEAENDGEESGNYEEKPKKITVEHVFKKVGADGSPQDFEPPHVTGGESEKPAESVEEENIRLRAQMEALALKEFSTQKTKVLDGISDPKRREQAENFIGDDPAKLETAKFMFGFDDGDYESEGTEPVPPKGKVKLLKKSKSASEQQTNVISELYKIRKREAVTPTEVAEQSVADQKIGELFDQMTQGLTDRQGNPYHFTVAQCSHCHTVLYGKDAKTWAEQGVCNVCGYKPKRRQ